jgi:hypothetical protein
LGTPAIQSGICSHHPEHRRWPSTKGDPAKLPVHGDPCSRRG